MLLGYLLKRAVLLLAEREVRVKVVIRVVEGVKKVAAVMPRVTLVI